MLKLLEQEPFFLEGDGVLLKRALTNFAQNLLRRKGYREVQPPFFMNKDVMAKCAQLLQFDEELYKVFNRSEHVFLVTLKPL